MTWFVKHYMREGKKKYMKSNQMEKNGELEGDFFRIEEQCGLFSYTIN